MQPEQFIEIMRREVERLAKKEGLAAIAEIYDTNKTHTLTIRVPRAGVVLKKDKRKGDG